MRLSASPIIAALTLTLLTLVLLAGILVAVFVAAGRCRGRAEQRAWRALGLRTPVWRRSPFPPYVSVSSPSLLNSSPVP